MNPYLEWVKSNIAIVVLVVVMIAAAIALPIISGGMNASLREEIKTRAANDPKLARIQTVKHAIEIPGQPDITSTGPANPKTIDLLGEYEKRLTADVTAVRDLILSRNRNGRELLVPSLFPNAPADWRDSLQFQFWRALMDESGAYPRLIQEINAGIPPSPAEIQADLQREDERYRTEKFAKSATDELTPDEQEELRNTLQQVRIGKYAERAQQLDMYASLNAIDAPYWDQKGLLELRQVFDWEWQLWIKQDILQALHSANEPYESLLQAPVKRVRWLTVTPLAAPSNTGSTASTPSSPFGGGSASAPKPAAPAQPGATGTAPNPSVEAQRDYAVSYTGRVSNALYDVRRARLQIVVDTARIPEVLDALARQNLMTVLNLEMRPTDAHADLADGYVYGMTTTSDLDLLIETVWLREWTAPLMPPQVKQILNPPVG